MLTPNSHFWFRLQPLIEVTLNNHDHNKHSEPEERTSVYWSSKAAGGAEFLLL